MRPVTVEHIVSQYFAEMPTEGVAPSWTPNTPGWYVRLYGNYQPFGHAGMDFKCPIGTPVHAIADGVVVWADWGYNLPGTGNIRKWLFYKNFPGILTVIQHDGWLSAYAHLSDNDAAPAGTTVKAGQLIGLSGDTGGVAAHLHVEALVDLSYRTGGGLIYGRTDPRKFFGSAAIAPQGDTKPKEGFLMALSDAKQERLYFLVDRYLDAPIGTLPDKVWSQTVLRGGKDISVKQELADTKTLVQGLQAAVVALSKNPNLNEAQITAAVKAGLDEGLVTVDVNVNGGK